MKSQYFESRWLAGSMKAKTFFKNHPQITNLYFSELLKWSASYNMGTSFARFLCLGSQIKSIPKFFLGEALFLGIVVCTKYQTCWLEVMGSIHGCSAHIWKVSQKIALNDREQVTIQMTCSGRRLEFESWYFEAQFRKIRLCLLFVIVNLNAGH